MSEVIDLKDLEGNDTFPDLELPGEPEKTPVAEEKGKPAAAKGKPDPVNAKYEKELAAAQKRIEELSNSERYWADQYRSVTGAKAQQAAPPSPEEDEEAETSDPPEKQVSDFANEGIKSLVRAGLLTKKDAKEMVMKIAKQVARDVSREEVQRATAEVMNDTKLYRDFPELQDQKSPLFHETAKILTESGYEASQVTHRDMSLAAQAARLRLGETGNGSKQRDRAERISAQSGDRTTRGGGFDGEGEDSAPPLMAIQKAFAEEMGLDPHKVYDKFNQQRRRYR